MQKKPGFIPSPPDETPPADALARYERNAAGLYLVHLSEFYDEVDPNQEPEAVEESVLLTLIQFKREEMPVSELMKCWRRPSTEFGSRPQQTPMRMNAFLQG